MGVISNVWKKAVVIGVLWIIVSFVLGLASAYLLQKSSIDNLFISIGVTGVIWLIGLAVPLIVGYTCSSSNESKGVGQGAGAGAVAGGIYGVTVGIMNFVLTVVGILLVVAGFAYILGNVDTPKVPGAVAGSTGLALGTALGVGAFVGIISIVVQLATTLLVTIPLGIILGALGGAIHGARNK